MFRRPNFIGDNSLHEDDPNDQYHQMLDRALAGDRVRLPPARPARLPDRPPPRPHRRNGDGGILGTLVGTLVTIVLCALVALGIRAGLNNISQPVTADSQQTSTSDSSASNIIPNPPLDESQAKQMVMNYYDTQGQFAGTFVMNQIDSFQFQQQDGDQLLACVGYEYADPSTPDTSEGTDSRIFTFHYNNTAWQVVSMGDYSSC